MVGVKQWEDFKFVCGIVDDQVVSPQMALITFQSAVLWANLYSYLDGKERLLVITDH